MFKVDSKKINKCLYGGRVVKKNNKKLCTITEKIIDLYKFKKYRPNPRQKRYELENFFEFKEVSSGGIKTKMGKREIVVKDCFDKMSNNENLFFWLYNTTNYYDEKFGGYTYLDEILCYLIAFCRNKIENIGEFIENKEQGEFDTNEIIEQKFKGGMKVYDKFRFKDYQTYARIKKLAGQILSRPVIVEATKEVVKKCIDDPELARADLISKVRDIAKSSDSDKVRLEAYKLLGNWLGVEKPIVQNNINVQMNAIENDLKRQGFDFDIEGFTVEDNDEE